MFIKSLYPPQKSKLKTQKVFLQASLLISIIASIGQLFIMMGLLGYLFSNQGQKVILVYIVASILATTMSIFTVGWLLRFIKRWQETERLRRISSLELLVRGEWQQGVEGSKELGALAESLKRMTLQLQELQEENADLKILLETVTQHGDMLSDELHNVLYRTRYYR